MKKGQVKERNLQDEEQKENIIKYRKNEIKAEEGNGKKEAEGTKKVGGI